MLDISGDFSSMVPKVAVVTLKDTALIIEDTNDPLLILENTEDPAFLPEDDASISQDTTDAALF